MWGKLSRLALFSVLLLPATAGLAGAQGVAPSELRQADRQAIQGTIDGQIEAFRRDDESAAFDFATPALQGQFGNARNFMGLVRGRYQPVYRPRSYAFGDAVNQDGVIEQEVGLIGPDGAPRTAIYTMERQPDGKWRIAGCRLVERNSPES